MASGDAAREARLRGDLEKIVGSAHVGGEECLARLCGPGGALAGNVVAAPGSPGEVAELVTYAVSTGTPVVPFGGGTRLLEVCPPESRGFFLSTMRMAKVVELEVDNLSVTVEAGLSNTALQGELSTHRLFLPVCPDSPRSTLGGQAARNHSAWRRYRHGKIGDFILGASFVTPTGKLVKTGGKTVKNASGYDLAKLLAGSWGNFAVITGIIFRLLPLPERLLLTTAEFPTVDDGLRTAAAILRHKTVLSSLNIFSTGSVEADATCGWNWTMALEGSAEAVTSHQKSLSALLPGEFTVEDGSTAAAAAKYQTARDALHSGRRATAVIDKRKISSLGPLLRLLLQQGIPFDGDLAAGVIEFALPSHVHGVTEFGELLAQRVAALQPGVRLLFDRIPPQPLLDRLSAGIDPAGIMFPNNLFRGGKAHGQGI